MSQEPLLSQYPTEKVIDPEMAAATAGAPLEDDTNLKVGDSKFSQVKTRVAGLSKPKKFLIAGAAAWVTASVIRSTVHHHGHHAHAHGHGPHAQQHHGVEGGDHFSHGPEDFEFGHPPHGHGEHGHHDDHDDEFAPHHKGPEHHHAHPDKESTTVAALYETPVVSQSADGAALQTANATFLLNHRRPLHINFIDAQNSRVVVSRAEGQEQPYLVVESAWTGDNLAPAAAVELISGHNDWLNVNATADASGHIVHIVLPVDAKSVPPLAIATDDKVALELAPSAADVRFRRFAVESAGDVELPALVSKNVHVSTSGSIKGSFNVSREITLKTVTGDIDATVHVVPGHPKGPKPPKGPKEPKEPKDEEHEHEHKEHEHKHEHEHAEFEHKEEERDRKPCEGKRQQARSWGSWFPFNIFGGDKKPEGDKPEHGDHPHGPPPPPVGIRAMSVSGSIDLHIHKPPFVSTRTFAKSATGDVKVHGLPSFHGHFVAGSKVGEVKVVAGPKEIHTIKDKVTEKGRFVEGFVHFANGTFPHPPHHNHTEGEPEHKRPEHKKPEEDEDDSVMERRQHRDHGKKHHHDDNDEADKFNFDDNEEQDGDRPPPPGPPGKGKGKGRRPPPKGEHPPPPPGDDDHPHPPHGDHPPPPPSGDHPEPPHGDHPPHKGPKGPGGPHGPPHGPPGFSNVVAFTEVGNVVLVL